MQTNTIHADVSNDTIVTAEPASRGKPFWRSLLETLIAIGIVILLARTFFTVITIDGDSMSPTFRAGQVLIVSRAPYALTTPRRGDVVAVRSRINPSKLLLFRVVGLPGDRLSMKGAQITIDDQPLREDYLPEPTEQANLNAAIGPNDLGTGQYFLLNDDRSNTDDSRTSGLFTLDELVGRAWLVVWPLG